jgi:tetratricopeptide (TPR) repeat protein
LGWSYNYLDESHRSTGNYSKALEYLGKVKEIVEKVFPAGHPYLAASFHNLAKVYNETKDLKLALGYAKKAVQSASKKLSDTHQ